MTDERSNRLCFHCQEPVETDLFVSQLGGEEVAHFCCRGCQAVAELVHQDGLDAFYQYRDSTLQKPEPLSDKDTAYYRLHDRDDVLERISKSDGKHRRIELGIEGITCAACVWLLETQIRRLDGVEEFWLSLSQHRAELRWDPRKLPLSQVLIQIHQLGFQPYPFSEGEAQKRLAQEQKKNLVKIGIAGIGMMQNMMLAIPVYLGLPEISGPEFQQLFWYVSLLIAIPVVFYSARPFFQAARRDFAQRSFSMDTPVSIAIGGAFAASAYVTLFGGEEVYFDSVCMFTFFLLIGRYLETQTRLAASRGQQKLQSNAPTLVTRLDESLDQGMEMVLLEDIRAGDRIVLKPGECVPADGTVIDGKGSVSEAALTGEFNPVGKKPGDWLLSGSALVDASLTLQVDRPPSDSHLSTLNQLVERALAEKPQQVALADRIASSFVLGVLGTAIIVAICWLFIDPSRAFPITLAVLVATCPCALSLATPTAMTAATHALRENGFVITRPHVLQALAECQHILFDKTGTLTSGQYGLVQLDRYSSHSEAELLAIAGALEQDSPHPIARFFAPYAQETADSLQQVIGEGVRGAIQGKAYQLGSAAFSQAEPSQALAGEQRAQQPDEATAKPVYLCESGELLAVFWLMDTWRPRVNALMQTLQKELGVTPAVITGDPSSHQEGLQKRLGIENVQVGLRPEDKLARVKETAGKGPTTVVGDGLNDVPAMAAAHLSIAMGNASDLTQMKADAMLINSEIYGLASVLRHARKCQRIIRQNIIWAIAYNASILPLAALGLVPPWVAAIGMSSSSLVVVFNALRLKKVRALG